MYMYHKFKHLHQREPQQHLIRFVCLATFTLDRLLGKCASVSKSTSIFGRVNPVNIRLGILNKAILSIIPALCSSVVGDKEGRSYCTALEENLVPEL